MPGVRAATVSGGVAPLARAASRAPPSRVAAGARPRPPAARRPGRNLLTARVAGTAADAPPRVEVGLDNASDVGATLLTLAAPGADDLLAEATGVLDALDLRVQSASIHREGGGSAALAFRLTDAQGRQLPETRWESVTSALTALWGGGSGALSSLPAIYGVAAEAEVKRLRPLSTGAEGDAAALELAAAEMAQAAAQLVAVEREVKGAPAGAGGDGARARRAEAAAVLERRMAAMEAVLASRRSAVAVAAPEPEREAPTGGTLLEQLLAAPPTAARAPASSGPAAGSGREIILQGFNWESHREAWYARLAAEAPRYARDGFTAVWLPPPSDSVSPQGYLPRDLYCLESRYGSEGDLRGAVRALHDASLKAVADIVINHRCAHTQDDKGRWNRFGGRLPWDESAICCNNAAFGGRGAHKTGEDYEAAPNVDHTQERVRSDLAKWLTYLRTSIGFDGWRFDFVKGGAGRGEGRGRRGWLGPRARPHPTRRPPPPPPPPAPPLQATAASLLRATSTRPSQTWRLASIGTRAGTRTASWTTTRTPTGSARSTGATGRAARRPRLISRPRACSRKRWRAASSGAWPTRRGGRPGLWGCGRPARSRSSKTTTPGRRSTTGRFRTTTSPRGMPTS